MTRSEQRQYWEDQLETFKKSGMTAKQWCQENEINIHRFNYWKRKCSAVMASTPTHWLPIDMQPEQESDALILRINDVSIEVRQGFDPGLLRLVVTTLASK